MRIPPWFETPDYFIWDAFDWASNTAFRVLKADAHQQEALLADTRNFYVVPDQFGVVEGHLLVLPKQRAPAIANLASALDDELVWLIAQVASAVERQFGAPPLVAEHGECGSTEPKDQAHVHVLPVPRDLPGSALRTVVEDVLASRGIVASYHDDAYPACVRPKGTSLSPYIFFSGPGVRFTAQKPSTEAGSQFTRQVGGEVHGLSPQHWDRRRSDSRNNMFSTAVLLGRALAQCRDPQYQFRPRAAFLEVALPHFATRA